MTRSLEILVVGGGAFGVAAGRELNRRGHRVVLLDPGPLPHPAASSTDISKAIRLDYGSDTFYMDLAAEAMQQWRVWNDDGRPPLYHECGFLLMSRAPMTPGTFEGDSFALLRQRGHPCRRIDRGELSRRFPAWSGEDYADGYFNPRCGWAASGEVMRRQVQAAAREGVTLVEGARVDGIDRRAGRPAAITADGQRRAADRIVVAAGAWTPQLLPELEDRMWATGQPVLWFRPADPQPYRGRQFPVWGADISRTGWYGFPANADGVVKVGHHGPGVRYRPGDPLQIPAGSEERFRGFLRRTFPGLADAALVGSRLCLYSDTFDGDFLIAPHPGRRGVVVAAGGSGHGFKFLPLLGEIVANVLEERDDARAARFGWREPAARRWEQARHDPSRDDGA